MLNSLARPTARATASRSHYICLSCRAKHHQAEDASSRDAPKTPPIDVSNKRDQVEIQAAFAKGLRNHNRSIRLRKHKLNTPTITIERDGKNGFIASLDFGEEKLTSTAHENASTAKALVKLLAMEHFKKRVQELADSHPNVLKRRAVPQTKRERVAARRAVDRALKSQEKSVDLLKGVDEGLIRKIVSRELSGREQASGKRIMAMETHAKSRPDGHEAQSEVMGQEALDIRESGKVARSTDLEICLDIAQRPNPSKAKARMEKVKDGGIIGLLMNQFAARAAAKRPDQASGTRKDTSSPAPSVKPSPDDKVKTVKRSRPPREAKEVLKLHKDSRTIEPLTLEHESLDIPTNPVPSLSYGLDRVLFNPGVYHVQDPRSRVYNFDPYLQKIIDPKHFDFAVLDEFRSPSADNTLSSVAEKHKVQYFSSTSAITGVLSHMHYLLSNFRMLNFADLSAGFLSKRGPVDQIDMEGDFTKFFKSPQSIYLKPKQGGYAIDKAEDSSSSGVLSFVGQCLEKLFTVPKEVFELYKKGSQTKPEPTSNAYHYTKFGSVLIRSQLDAHDDRLPGTGMFDIKTRAALPIRMDGLETKQHIGRNYEIKQLHGQYESFEREFHDMSRATMLKYSLQARLGRMDGIFLAYHNIARIFGFQYLSLADLDKVLHGQTDTILGDAELSSSLRIMSELFDRATALYPDEPLRLYFETRKVQRDAIVYVVPVTNEEIEQQHERAQQVSRDYLARLNASDAKHKSDVDTGDDAADATPATAVEADGPEATKPDVSTALAAEPEEDGDSWLDRSRKQTSADESAAEDDGAAEGLTAHELGEEYDRLHMMLNKIRHETDYLHSRGFNRNDAKVQRLMLEDITKKTFSVEKEVEQFAAKVENGNEDAEPDLQNLRSTLEEQKKFNQELYDQAEQKRVLTGTDIKDLTNSQTLEDFFKSATKRYVPPERLSAFKIVAQSRLDGVLLEEPPKNVHKNSQWELTYAIEEIENASDVENMYAAMLKSTHSASLFSMESQELRRYFDGDFFQQLMKLSRKGKKWREQRDKEDEGKEPVIFEPKN